MGANKITVIETFDCKHGKVSETTKLLNKIDAKGRILLVVSEKDDYTYRATNNLQNVTVVFAKYVNVYDIMNADTVVISKKALDIVTEWLGGKA